MWLVTVGGSEDVARRVRAKRQRGGGGGGHQASPRRVTPHPDPSWMLRLSEGASHETETGKMLEEGP